MRRFALLLLVAVALAPATASARPLTTPSPENERDLAWYFDQAADKYRGKLDVFPDVDIRDPAYGAAALLKRLDVIHGFQDGTLRTWAPVTRAEALKVILRALHPRSHTRAGQPTGFPDVGHGDWAAPYVAFAVDAGMIRGYDDGTFRPAGHVSRYEARKMLGLEAHVTAESALPATRGEILRLTAEALPLDPPQPMAHSTQLTLRGRDILANGVPVRGLLANWQIRERFNQNVLTREYIGGELDRMRALGFIGVTTEVGWEETEPDEGRFTYPAEMELLFEEAARRGMWVSLLLAPHYTPRWPYHKHGDIWLYDSAGRRVPMGEYMTFSPSSPAALDQAHWQATAAAHYARHPNLLSIFLSNEQSYGNKHALDFSTWAETRWQQWRASHGLAPAPMPRSPVDPERLAWARFRQDNLNAFLNSMYEAVAPALPRFVPVAHKVIFYEATSAFAPQYGLRPTPGRLQGDIVGADIYGLTPNVYPAQLAHGKPISVVETNLPGDWSADAMRRYLVYQALQGITIQGVYRWNPCEDENCLFRLDGTPWEKARQLREAAMAIAALPDAYPLEQPSIAIILPANAVAVTGYEYRAYQYRFDELVTRYESVPGAVLKLVWSDDLLVDPDVEVLRSPAEILRGLQKVYFILPATDRDASEGLALRTWIQDGGTLLIDADQAANLPWIGRTLPGHWYMGAGKVVICEGRC